MVSRQRVIWNWQVPLLLLGLVVGGLAPVMGVPRVAQAIAQTVDSRKAEIDRLLEQGAQQYQTSQFTAALQSWQQALKIARDIKDRRDEGAALGNLGAAYRSLGNYAKAIEFHQQHLAIAREIKDRRGEGNALGNLGVAYSSLGNHSKAIEYLEQRLAIAREIKDRRGEGNSLGNLGIAYRALGNYGKAIEYYEQTLAIARTLKDRQGEDRALGNLGNAYRALGNPSKAIEYYQQVLAIARETKDRRSEGASVGNLGAAYGSLGNSAKALEYLEQYLAIAREIKDREGERLALNNIGATLQQQKQFDLAIVFYKQSVNVSESIRGDLRPLPRDLQTSYTQTVASTYRALADLLLAQGRVLEAQQVLELLKVQELRDYTRDTRAGGEIPGAPLNAIEAPVKPAFDTLIALGLQLTTCESQRPRCANRAQLAAQRTTAKAQFDQQAARLRKLAQQQGSQDPAQLQSSELTNVAIKIVKAQPKTVLIYPLVLEDKLWLVYGLQGGKEDVIFASKEIPVTRQELSATVAEFRKLLEDRNSDLKQLQQVSQKLYGWLIAPLRSQLDAKGIQNLVFSLDRATRYMPLAALHDGKAYLAQRFTLSTIFTAGLTDTTDKLSPNPVDNPVLGLGLSRAVSGFNALPSVPAELDAIVRSQAPDTQGIFQGSQYLDQAFTLDAFKDLLDYRILHIATHGKFDSTDPDQSFLLLGNGDRLRVPDIRQLSGLGGIHLAVLSACETAKGGPDKDGIEVAGLSYYFLNQNVKSVLASLWLVNDASTALLMQQFYKNLAGGTLTKAEALRQVQRDFIDGKLTAKDAPNRSDIEVRVTDATRQIGPQTFVHPYYWAPFILIGNSL